MILVVAVASSSLAMIDYGGAGSPRKMLLVMREVSGRGVKGAMVAEELSRTCYYWVEGGGANAWVMRVWRVGQVKERWCWGQRSSFHSHSAVCAPCRGIDLSYLVV